MIVAAVRAFIALSLEEQSAKATAAVSGKNQASTLKRYSDLYLSDWVLWCTSQGIYVPTCRAAPRCAARRYV